MKAQLLWFMKKIPVRQIKTDQNQLPSPGRFKIRRVEDIVGNTDLVHELHRHDFYFILAIQNGKGVHEIDFEEYKVSNGSIFFLRPGQVHQLELKAGSEGYLLEFDTEFYHPQNLSVNQRLRKASSKSHCKLETARFNRLHALLTSMFQESADKEDGYRDAIKANLDLFFIEYVRQSADPKQQSTARNSYAQDRYEEFMDLVNKNISSAKQVSQYCNLMNLSLYQLNEITKSAVGKTASEMINDHIMLEAKRYLMATSNQVKEIADILGYEDVSYFIRFFKKHSGHSPETFRKNFK